MVLKLAQPANLTTGNERSESDLAEWLYELSLVAYRQKDIDKERLVLAKQLEKIALKVKHSNIMIPWFVGCKCDGCVAEEKLSVLVGVLRESVKTK